MFITTPLPNQALTARLQQHPIFTKIHTQTQLRQFMEQHVFAVYDFMVLLKAVQHVVSPTGADWRLRAPPHIARAVNEIVLVEESDLLRNGHVRSHFALYLMAMEEIGADTSKIRQFVRTAYATGFADALHSQIAPSPATGFMHTTHAIVTSNDPAAIIAAFCYGRETIIPMMFQRLLEQVGVDEQEAPTFFEYVRRHIQVDGDLHGDLSMQMVEWIRTQDPAADSRIIRGAEMAIEARLRLWDGVMWCLDVS